MGSQQLPGGVVAQRLSVVAVEGAAGVAICLPQW